MRFTTGWGAARDGFGAENGILQRTAAVKRAAAFGAGGIGAADGLERAV
jgi:hypothetical protein